MAGQITMAQYKSQRAEGVVAYGGAAAEATLAAADKEAASKVTAKCFIKLGQIWTGAPSARLKNSASMRDDVTSDFNSIKVAAEDAVLEKHDARTEAFEQEQMDNPGSKRFPLPRLSRENARKNSTKGIRQRRSTLMDMLECISADPALARDAFSDKADLTWTEICIALSDPRRARAEAEDLVIFTGLDKKGRIHALGHDYKDTHEVSTRTLEDGTVQEYTTTSVAVSGTSNEVDVVIGTNPSGPLYAEEVVAMEDNKEDQAIRMKNIRLCEEAARLPEFFIPESRPRLTDESV